MVGTIIPMVHGKRRTQRIPRLLLVHSLGSLVGGLSIGLLIGAVSSLFWRSANRPWLLVDSVVGFIAIGYSLTELGLLRLPAPQSYWTVPRQWAATKSEGTAVGLYGFSLGLGLLTPINTCLYAVIIWALLVGQFWECVFAMSVLPCVELYPFAPCLSLPQPTRQTSPFFIRTLLASGSQRYGRSVRLRWLGLEARSVSTDARNSREEVSRL